MGERVLPSHDANLHRVLSEDVWSTERRAYLQPSTLADGFKGLLHLRDQVACRYNDEGTKPRRYSRRQNLHNERKTVFAGHILTSTIGVTYASVFPLPVGAETHASLG